MPSVFGYFLCLVVLTPALSLDVFLTLLGKTPRQHDFLAVFSTLLQLLATVTSPVKIGITLGILFCAYAARRATLAFRRNNELWYADGI
jgi:hypothetical protein